MRSMVIALVLTAAFVTLALADDFMSPDWRGDPLTVMVEWDFVNDFNPDPYNILPDQLVTVGDGGIHELGTAFTHAHASDTVIWGDDGAAHTAELPGQIDFFLVNWIDEYEFKHIWIQLTFSGLGVPFVSGVVGPNPDTNDWTDPTYGQLVYPIEVDPNHRLEYWLLIPNPDREHVYVDLPPFTTLEQIVIDTISTPEPVATRSDTWGGVKDLFR